MTTKLDKALKRELKVDGKPHVLTITPAGFKLVRKGNRKGLEMNWTSLVNGDAALAVSLNASLAAMPPAREQSKNPRGRAPAGRAPRKK